MEKRSENSKSISDSKEKMLLRAYRKRLSLAASVTVEASIVLPIFLFFFVNLLCIFDILKLQCDLEAALHQAGSQIMINKAATKSFLGYGGGESDKDIVAGAVNAAMASRMVKNYLGEDRLDHSPICNGASGLSFAQTLFETDSDIIDIIATYKVHPLFGISAFKEFPVEGRFYGHAFTGYDVRGSVGEENEEEDELVYITEHGTAYHKSLDCSHLKLSVKSVSKKEVSSKRNKDRGKFYPCEYCGKRAGQTVYITNYGNKYHSDRNCSGIKRTIRTVRLSEAAGRSPCKECAN
ncbi:hypothetical protein [Butyrivibrio sp. AC2005]|uniref:hypothetical protein n=1 Tax=Butyrivibrio sp. AC2005 TaxID=1280672 RepID=UPI0004144AEB|nr:hypothetical protein [Butyrivibrio sp. AC2005]